jgi:hypothetical protein
MKPILKKEIASFLKRFDNFRDAELRSLEIISATSIKLVFATQDSSRAFDWITIKLEFNGVSDAKLIQEKQLSFIDMSEGITLLEHQNKFAFAISECYNATSILNSSLYIMADNLKYQEEQF